jgi:ParB/RepB/Spo0J family partition protein
VRLDRDEEKLGELANDILRRGLIEPLKVVAVADRFEVVDGYRRLLAVQRANIQFVEAFVYPTKEDALEGIKYAANAYREDMSPAEEAQFFYALYEGECEHDLERVAAMVSKKLSYVQNRIALLEGDDEVFLAVRDRTITLGVAAELNKLPDANWRRYFLGHAIRSGATLSVVSGWVMDWKTTHGGPVAPASATPAMSVIVPGPVYDPMRCYLCGKSDPRFIPEQLSFHTHCKHANLNPMVAAFRGVSETEL